MPQRDPPEPAVSWWASVLLIALTLAVIVWPWLAIWLMWGARR